ncbi:LRR receptor-like serine/threonine-protein kinase IOS1 isoform X2 [Ziziphus jujuba]|uniref:non-specific serine/threonine protein kinase n=1 Tax=Ziziphus jujuba TaxID=326968 RepID=A0ABM4A3I7_ZIZJJ|nr:LRR receptor-like serine/threonine-protein kinase IOS1 isoform X2 [Ziziphus jujuba]
MIMSGIFKLLGVFLIILLVDAHDQTGFISIDCGRPHVSNYSEKTTGLVYIPDTTLTDSGESKSILDMYKYDNQQQLWYLRSFSDGSIRNCHKIHIKNGDKYLIRAGFLYGNYDGQEKSLPIKFDLRLGANVWDSVEVEDSATYIVKELIHVPLQNYLYICLLNTGSGTPFISSIELRPLGKELYETQLGSLALVNRLDTGPIYTKPYRYPVDDYDRFWYSHRDGNWTNISTMLPFDDSDHDHEGSIQLPAVVMSTAATPKIAKASLEYELPSTDHTASSPAYYVYMHFAEIQDLQTNQSREFTVSYNGNIYFEDYSPKYLQATTLSIDGVIGGQHLVISMTANSTLPPIINAIEVYVVKEFFVSDTDEKDADAITKIKSTYGIERNWKGDPCIPKIYLWEGLNCSYADSNDPPRIISLNLSSSGLTGKIPLAISDLSMLEVLDLSNNNFTGPVPEFLSNLQNLRVLNLEKNDLNGSIPVQLIERQNDGSLKLDVDQNPNLCISDSCKRKTEKNAVNIVPIVASIAGAFVLLLTVMAIYWAFKRKQKPSDKTDEKSITEYGTVESMKQQFTWAEIQSITNNFERVLGKGGFGTIYHGYINNDTQVAVKVLSASSFRGYQQFHAEVSLLMRVHHRNLTALVGYCNDGNNACLIYEYMANGNLKTHISGGSSSNILKWEDRLRIAIEAAQGLEYLHDGCKPPIVHRDVKSTNILLNENFQAKLSDFGLSKIFPNSGKTYVSTGVAGTPGYLDPDIFRFAGTP